MQQEFIDAYDELFDRGIKRLRKAWVLKLETITACRKQQEEEAQKKIERQIKREADIQDSISLSSISSCEFAEEDGKNEVSWKNHYKIERKVLAEIDTSSEEEVTESDSSSKPSSMSSENGTPNGKVEMPEVIDLNDLTPSAHKTPKGVDF